VGSHRNALGGITPEKETRQTLYKKEVV